MNTISVGVPELLIILVIVGLLYIGYRLLRSR